METTSTPLSAPRAAELAHGPRLAGDLAIWIFILAELLAFGVFFAAYAFTRSADNVQRMTDDLETALDALEGLRTRPPYRLDRRWRDDLGLPPEAFALFEIHERVSPLGLAVIAHHYPCRDTLAAWFEHANSAEEVAGLIFGAATPGPMAGRAALGGV